MDNRFKKQKKFIRENYKFRYNINSEKLEVLQNEKWINVSIRTYNDIMYKIDALDMGFSLARLKIFINRPEIAPDYDSNKIKT